MTRHLPSPAAIFATVALLLPPLALYAPKALVAVSAAAALAFGVLVSLGRLQPHARPWSCSAA